MPETALWPCTRQRAGPLIKECRGQWPTLSRHDDPIARESKRSIKRVRTMFSFDHAVEIGAYYSESGWELEPCPMWENPGVTHWMPLPNPPEEGTA